MQVLPDQLLRKSLKIKNDIPVYYISEKVMLDSVEKEFGSDLEIVMSYGTDRMDELIDKRPFDECVMILGSHDNDPNVGIVHFTKDGSFRNFVFFKDSLEIQNTTVRERFSFDDIDIERDKKLIHANNTFALYCITPFAIKKNKIILAEGRTVKHGKKGKIKKQKYIYVSSSTYEAVKSGVSTYVTYSVHSVAGHVRRYEKNPDTNGHDRNGNDVVGWTWVRPYVTGEGLEIMEKIRIWR